MNKFIKFQVYLTLSIFDQAHFRSYYFFLMFYLSIILPLISMLFIARLMCFTLNCDLIKNVLILRYHSINELDNISIYYNYPDKR